MRERASGGIVTGVRVGFLELGCVRNSNIQARRVMTSRSVLNLVIIYNNVGITKIVANLEEGE